MKPILLHPQPGLTFANVLPTEHTTNVTKTMGSCRVDAVMMSLSRSNRRQVFNLKEQSVTPSIDGTRAGITSPETTAANMSI
jgi:hypothetical protein